MSNGNKLKGIKTQEDFDNFFEDLNLFAYNDESVRVLNKTGDELEALFQGYDANKDSTDTQNNKIADLIKVKQQELFDLSRGYKEQYIKENPPDLDVPIMYDDREKKIYKSLNADQKLELSHAQQTIDQLVLNPLLQTNFNISKAEEWINETPAPQAIKDILYGEDSEEFLSLKTAIDSLISKTGAKDSSVGTLTKNYYDNIMGQIVFSQHRGPSEQFILSPNISNAELMRNITQWESNEKYLMKLKTSPNSSGEYSQAVYDDEYVGVGENRRLVKVIKEPAKNRYNEIFNEYKVIESELGDMETILNNKRAEEAASRKLFIEQTTSGSVLGTGWSGKWPWTNKVLPNIISPNVWGDMNKGLKGNLDLLHRSFWQDFSRAIAWPLHTYSAFEEDANMRQDHFRYNPVTDEFGDTESKILATEAQEIRVGMEKHAKKNEGLLNLATTIRAKEKENLRLYRDYIEPSGYEEILNYLDYSEVKEILESKTPAAKTRGGGGQKVYSIIDEN